MKADYVTYQKATGRGVVGAVIHAVLCVAFLIYGIKARDHAAVSAAWFIGLGVIVWLGLIIVHDQSRRERIEALEQESLTANQGGSVFEGAGDFRVAARRLEFVERWLLPIFSLLFGAGLVTMGVIRFMNALDDHAFHAPAARGWGLALWITAAIVGFPFARYIAGMAKQPAWTKLRAGAGQSVAMALIGLLMITAHFVDIWGPDSFLRWMQVVVPGFMVLLGAEVFVSFLLDLYRPRKAGEVRTIAADSRLMSFAAAPDRIAESVSDAINYQFGYNVTSTWLFQLLSRSVANLVALGLVMGWLLSCAVVIQPHQRGLVLRFGNFAREVEPGLHFKLPWPMERVVIPAYVERNEAGRLIDKGETTTGLRTTQLGTPPPGRDREEAILWTNEHAAGEVFFIVRPSPFQAGSVESTAQDSAWLSDLALMAAEIPVRYAVKNVEAFERLGAPDQRDELLRAVAQRAVMRTLKQYSVDDILGPTRTEIAPRIRAAINAAFDKLNPGPDGKPIGAGIEVVAVSVQGVHPAKQVAPSYEKVVQAEQLAAARLESANAAAMDTLIRMTGSSELAAELVAAIDEQNKLVATNAAETARRQSDEKIAALVSRCQGTVAQTLAEARSARWTKHLGARERALQYSGQVDSFEANPTLFRAHLFYDTLVQAIREARLVVTDDVRRLKINADLTEKSAEGTFTVYDAESAAAASNVK